jgi:hypothetical protein
MIMGVVELRTGQKNDADGTDGVDVPDERS